MKKFIAIVAIAVMSLTMSTPAEAAEVKSTTKTIVQYSFYIPFVGYYYWEYTVDVAE